MHLHRTSLIAATLWLLTTSQVLAGPDHRVHPDLADQTLVWVHPEPLRVDRFRVEYRVAYQTPHHGPQGQYTPAFIESTMARASVAVLDFMETQRLPLGHCKSDHLDLYILDHDLLNDHSRFTEWGPANGVTDKRTFTLWALFDPLRNRPGEVAALLTEKGLWADEILLAHEMAHYWYEQMCTALSWREGTESFALALEEVYEAEMRRR